MKDNLILIGFMGAGKTSVGQCFAAKYGWPVLDTDCLIEEDAGMAISEIFAEKGEEAFRSAETQMLERLLARTDRTVISAGGGLPLRGENREKLSRLGRVVFLRVSANTVLSRLADDTTRPLLQGDGKEEKVRRLLADRNPVYEAAASLTVDVDGRTPEEIADWIARACGWESAGNS